MKEFFSYVRVSTARQGEHTVSLQEQRAANERCAANHNVKISQTFEERQTAAKHGRRVFSKMLKLLRAGKAAGVIMHKIDRSARNLKDWADLGELIDSGIEVYFANEPIDLRSRGGRLAADIQAVVASDFIRNLREETKKGFYGRLKQGFYPRPAPLGYLDAGAGKAKLIDPERGPLVKRAFELYATGKYTQTSLLDELHRLGLRNRGGKKLEKNFVARTLKNPFYMGIIHIDKVNEDYLGAHKTLISKRLFDEVQNVLSGNFSGVRSKHDFLFRQLFSCKACGRSLIGETRKGYIYYRCHNKACPATCVREELIEQTVVEKLPNAQVTIEQYDYLARKLAALEETWKERQKQSINEIKIQLAAHHDRMNTLTDAYLDNALERDAFEQRKTALLKERRDLEDKIQDLSSLELPQIRRTVDRVLGLIKSPYSLYISGSPDEKRDLLKTLYSDRHLQHKNLEITWSSPFSEVANCVQITDGSPPQGDARTWDKLAEFIFNFARKATGEQGVKI